MTKNSSVAAFLIAFIGMVLAGCALILLLPTLFRPHEPWREWTAPEFEVDAEHPVPAGIDGEAVRLEPPLRFRIRPGVLRVRVAPHHPGASPSALLPEGVRQSVRALARIAAGRDRRPAADPIPTLPTAPMAKES